MPTNPTRDSQTSAGTPTSLPAAPTKARKDPKASKEAEELQQDQFKTEIEERPYLDTEGGD